MFLTGRLRRGRRGDVGNPPKTRHPSAAKGHAARARPARTAARARSTQRRSPAGAIERCCRSGFGSALRRSEVVALDVDDLAFDPARGLKVTIGGSKTRPGAGRSHRGGAYAHARDRRAVRDALCGLQTRLAAAAIHRGPVFRQIAPRRHAHRPTAVRPVDRADRQAPRGRRRGRPGEALGATRCAPRYATTAAGRAGVGVEERKIANVTRHTSVVDICSPSTDRSKPQNPSFAGLSCCRWT
jgi:hypothetical protein